MLEDTLFWLGLSGFIVGTGVGLSLLEEESDPFLRNVMFAVMLACVMFIYLSTLGEETPLSPFLLLFSLLIGGTAALFVAFAAHGNLRAAFVAGGVAGILLQVMIKILPPGSFGFTGLHDLPTAIDILVPILAVAGIYYLLRNWGKEGETWD
jgi:hypothetical protein